MATTSVTVVVYLTNISPNRATCVRTASVDESARAKLAGRHDVRLLSDGEDRPRPGDRVYVDDVFCFGGAVSAGAS
jgi:hypothetical protein